MAANELRETADRIQSILDDSVASGDAKRVAAVEEVVRGLSSLYGAGLRRILEITNETCEQPEALLKALGRDELISSLLVLHELHPVDVRTRIENGLARVRPYLASHGGDVEVLDIDTESGVVHMRLNGSCDGCPSSAETLRYAVETAVKAAAPEIGSLEVEGLRGPQYAEEDLIPLETVTRPEAPADWLAIPAPALGDGHGVLLNLDSQVIVAVRLAGRFYAYRNQCPSCGAEIEEVMISEDALVCPSCSTAFDIQAAGRRRGDDGLPLTPIPLLEEQGSLRVAVGGVAV